MSGQVLAGRRVAVVNWRDLGHALAGGSERYAWEYALALREAGARVDFVTARDAGQSAREVIDDITVVRRGGVFTFYLFAAWYYLSHRRVLDAVVDPECGIPTFSPLFLRRRTPVVLVVHHVHQAQFLTYFPWWLARIGQLLESKLMPLVYRRAETVAVSSSTHDEMVRQLAWRRPVRVLWNGSTEPDLVSDPADKDPHRVVVLGRLVPHKRVGLVVRAVAELQGDFPDLRLDIVGRGPDEDALRELVRSQHLEERVTLLGFVSDAEKARVLRRAALHVCASDIEGWGQVVIDAAAHGVPTIARDVPGLRDSIRDGATGWLVPDTPDDLEEVRRALTQRLRLALRETESLQARRAHADACLEWAAQYSWTRMHREAVDLVAGAIGRRTARRRDTGVVSGMAA